MKFEMFKRLWCIIIAVMVMSVTAGMAFDECEWRTKVAATERAKLYAPHFKDGLYFNPWMPFPKEEHNLGKLLKWKLAKKAPYSDKEQAYLPRTVGNAMERVKQTKGGFILWLGHAAFFMRLKGDYWLTDPMLSKRAFLPKRRVPAALSLEELSSWQANLNVVISHNHYDHLDKKSIKSLPSHARVYVPLGLKSLVQKWGKFKVVEMDWWQSDTLNSGSILACLPAQHWSRRAGAKEMSTLWASFMFLTDSLKIYFGGDTGYFIGFEEFGRRYGPVDYALLPVGAYHPRWFMHYNHLNIEEALDAFLDLRATHFIPMHWGAFELGDEPAGYPALDLQEILKVRSDINPASVLQMEVGEIKNLP